MLPRWRIYWFSCCILPVDGRRKRSTCICAALPATILPYFGVRCVSGDYKTLNGHTRRENTYLLATLAGLPPSPALAAVGSRLPLQHLLPAFPTTLPHAACQPSALAGRLMPGVVAAGSASVGFQRHSLLHCLIYPFSVLTAGRTGRRTGVDAPADTFYLPRARGTFSTLLFTLPAAYLIILYCGVSPSSLYGRRFVNGDLKPLFLSADLYNTFLYTIPLQHLM